MILHLLTLMILVTALLLSLRGVKPKDKKLELENDLPHWEKYLVLSANRQYEGGNEGRAKFFLDRILAQKGAHPDATMLRSRIALEEGRARFTLELVNEQLELRPHCNKLWETQAAVHYMTRNYEKANTSLTIARNLGSSDLRINQLHAKVFEASGDLESALNCYQSALAFQPNDKIIKARTRVVQKKIAQTLKNKRPSLFPTGNKMPSSFRAHDFLLD